eukprot:1172111-Prorocentrum_minimum.AAC.2
MTFSVTHFFAPSSASYLVNSLGHVNQCAGATITTDPSLESHRWQTPSKGKPDHLPSYQSYNSLVGHARVVYAADHQSAIVTVVTKTKDPKTTLLYSFQQGEPPSASNTKAFDTSFTTPLAIVVTGSDGSRYA